MAQNNVPWLSDVGAVLAGTVYNATTSAYSKIPSIEVPASFDAMASRLPSLRSVAQLTLGALLPAFQGASAGAPATCTNTQLSCHNTSAVANTCCFNAPGGQLLQTQFWDTNPSTGPSDSWTIHGLW